MAESKSNETRNVQQEESTWNPKTRLGKEVLQGKYSRMEEVLLTGRKIMEPEITDYLLPDLSTELINVGQAKGKFGGGKRKTSKSTQKKTREGSNVSFTMIVASGNKQGIVGLGFGKAIENVPAREKAVKKAKENLIVIRRGCGDWGCFCGGSHSIPFSVEGKCGSAEVKLLPAPKGTGLVVEAELRKALELAGIKDVWSQTKGNTKNKVNFMKAGLRALEQLEEMRLNQNVIEGRGIKEGDRDEQ